MRGKVLHAILAAALFLLAPLALLGLDSLYSPLREVNGDNSFHVSPSGDSPTEHKKSGHPTVSILPSEGELWTPELPLHPIDLSSQEVLGTSPYSLYHVPSEEWYTRAKIKVDAYKPLLKDALKHVDDVDQRITLVTCLFDLGRDKLKGFTRGFDEYINRFQRIIDVKMPMIIFMETDKVSKLKFHPGQKVLIIPFSIDQLAEHYPNYFNRIEEIRSSKLYLKQAQMTGWLADSPQASLKYYNLMVMTKVFLLRYGAKINPFRTQYIAFLDAGHLCGPILKQNNLNLLRKHMGKMMVTFFQYGAGLHGESHGMTQKAYRHYVGPKYSDPNTWEKEWCCNIVRGGFFGGTPVYIDAVAEAYNEVLAQSLSDGYMGTEENILGATYYRFPELFNGYENPGGDNCAIFSASTRGGVDREIYVHPAEPDEYHV